VAAAAAAAVAAAVVAVVAVAAARTDRVASKASAPEIYFEFLNNQGSPKPTIFRGFGLFVKLREARRNPATFSPVIFRIASKKILPTAKGADRIREYLMEGG
jgi:hypothetical protein